MKPPSKKETLLNDEWATLPVEVGEIHLLEPQVISFAVVKEVYNEEKLM